MQCSNCEVKIETPNHLVVSDGYDICARVCSACVDGVLIMKVVLKRNSVPGKFTFEGYLPVASVK